ncbi:type III pantothenate kinase [bacterium]|nr:type III pantothenate kinase [bacterium]
MSASCNVFDVGNSRIEFVRFGESGVIEDFLFIQGADTFPSAVSEYILDGENLVLSVNPAAGGLLISRLEHIGVCPKALTAADFSPALEIDYDVFSLGVDRIASAFASIHLGGRSPLKVVVDAGTAVTVDVVHDGRFTGGVILPGWRVVSHSLSNICALLPELKELHFTRPFGKRTDECIKAGIRNSLVGGVMRSIKHIQEAIGEEAEIFLTGGDANLIFRYLPAGTRYYRFLVHLGAYILFLDGYL